MENEFWLQLVKLRITKYNVGRNRNPKPCPESYFQTLNPNPFDLTSAETTIQRPNQTDLVVATYLINEMVGDLRGKHPTVVFGEDSVDSQSSAGDIIRILDEASSGKIDVLFIENLDLVYHFPGNSESSAKIAEKLNKEKNIVFFCNEPNDSMASVSNAFILPHGTELETWGASERKFSHYALRQPVMKTQEGISIRQTEDVLLSIARNTGLKPAPAANPVVGSIEDALDADQIQNPKDVVNEKQKVVGANDKVQDEADGEAGTKEANVEQVLLPLPTIEEESFVKYIHKYWKAIVHVESKSTQSFTDFWISSLQDGGYFGESQNINSSLEIASSLQIDS